MIEIEINKISSYIIVAILQKGHNRNFFIYNSLIWLRQGRVSYGGSTNRERIYLIKICF